MVKNLRRGSMGLVLAALWGVIAVPCVSAQEPETARKVAKRVAPAYPPIALKANLWGTVKLSVDVSPEGAVTTIRTLGGNAILVTAAEEAVKKWKYEPAKKATTEAIVLKFEKPAI